VQGWSNKGDWAICGAKLATQDALIPVRLCGTLSTKASLLATFPEMSITAAVDNPKDIPWGAGTVVRIEQADERAPTLFGALEDFDGMAGDLPSDRTSNLRHGIDSRE
jgi:hypothetical protein